MTSATGTSGRADLIPNPYHQGTRRRTGEQVDDQFVESLLAILGDCRLLWLPNLTDTTTSTDKGRYAATITWSESLASFDTTRARLGAGVAVAFNGSDEEGDVPDADRFSFGDGENDSPFSVLALVKPAVNNAFLNILAKSIDANDREWEFLLSNSGHLSVGLHDESSSGVIGRTYGTPFGTGWGLAGFTYNGSKAATGIRVYKDGAKVDDTDNSTGTYTAMENGAGLVQIGARYTTPQRFFDGTIALIAITAREISPEEMWAIKELVNGYFGLDL